MLHSGHQGDDVLPGKLGRIVRRDHDRRGPVDRPLHAVTAAPNPYAGRPRPLPLRGRRNACLQGSPIQDSRVPPSVRGMIIRWSHPTLDDPCAGDSLGVRGALVRPRRGGHRWGGATLVAVTDDPRPAQVERLRAAARIVQRDLDATLADGRQLHIHVEDDGDDEYEARIAYERERRTRAPISGPGVPGSSAPNRPPPVSVAPSTFSSPARSRDRRERRAQPTTGVHTPLTGVRQSRRHERIAR